MLLQSDLVLDKLTLLQWLPSGRRSSKGGLRQEDGGILEGISPSLGRPLQESRCSPLCLASQLLSDLGKLLRGRAQTGGFTGAFSLVFWHLVGEAVRQWWVREKTGRREASRAVCSALCWLVFMSA